MRGLLLDASNLPTVVARDVWEIGEICQVLDTTAITAHPMDLRTTSGARMLAVYPEQGFCHICPPGCSERHPLQPHRPVLILAFQDKHIVGLAERDVFLACAAVVAQEFRSALRAAATRKELSDGRTPQH